MGTETALPILCPICNWTRPDFNESGVCEECWGWFNAEVEREIEELERWLG